jgi:UV DNA damage endonuclease
MRIGYPCINRGIGCQGDKTFRLKSYSEERLTETVANNLACLWEMLRFNVKHNILFFRITSDLVPFASHPVCKFNWQRYFKKEFRSIGDYAKAHNIRISVHPDQFTLINSKDPGVLKRSIKELVYHCEVLDLMVLDSSAKIQIHVGGVYGEKAGSKKRFVSRFGWLDGALRDRLAIENDDRNYTIGDCIEINGETGIPVIFDLFHHELNSSGESVKQAFGVFGKTWRKRDGIPIVDYSSQESGKRKGKHAETINLEHFREFLKESKPFDCDIMLEIKDKEKSALKAMRAAWGDRRLVKLKQGR